MEDSYTGGTDNQTLGHECTTTMRIVITLCVSLEIYYIMTSLQKFNLEVQEFMMDYYIVVSGK
jgi:hypothetical protein